VHYFGNINKSFR